MSLAMNPTGWFQVAWSTDVEVGQIVPLTYFDTELVAFRGEDGDVHVLNAHCQHLGANLSRGCVVEKAIQCPFHGWVWDGNGRNVEIPYESEPNRVRRVRSWPVAERNECIYVWRCVTGRAASIPRQPARTRERVCSDAHQAFRAAHRGTGGAGDRRRRHHCLRAAERRTFSAPGRPVPHPASP